MKKDEKSTELNTYFIRKTVLDTWWYISLVNHVDMWLAMSPNKLNLWNFEPCSPCSPVECSRLKNCLRKAGPKKLHKRASTTCCSAEGYLGVSKDLDIVSLRAVRQVRRFCTGKSPFSLIRRHKQGYPFNGIHKSGVSTAWFCCSNW